MKKSEDGSRFTVATVWFLFLFFLLFPGNPHAKNQAEWSIKPAAQLGGWRNDMVVPGDINMLGGLDNDTDPCRPDLNSTCPRKSMPKPYWYPKITITEDTGESSIDAVVDWKPVGKRATGENLL